MEVTKAPILIISCVYLFKDGSGVKCLNLFPEEGDKLLFVIQRVVFLRSIYEFNTIRALVLMFVGLIIIIYYGKL